MNPSSQTDVTPSLHRAGRAAFCAAEKFPPSSWWKRRSLASKASTVPSTLSSQLLPTLRSAARVWRIAKSAATGREAPLHGIPISLKDNFWTKGVRTTAGSKILEDFVPAADSDVALRLERAGAILLGKTNMHEFAYGITSENPHFGAVRNPWAPERISGRVQRRFGGERWRPE